MKKSPLHRIRVALAAIVFPLITLLFLDFTGTIHQYFGWLAKVQFLPALLAMNVIVVLALVLLTLLMGRIYCSVICPLGILQDIFSHYGGKMKRNRFKFSPEKKWLRIGFLAVFVAVMVAGFGSIAALIAPYSAFGRIVSALVQPHWMGANNILANIAEHYNSYAFYSVEIWAKGVGTIVVAALTLVIVGVLAWKNGRSYCNTVCPVGTILGILSKYSWFKVRIDADKCVNCGLCEKNCKASAINSKEHTVDYSRCVDCGLCMSKCAKGAISFCHKAKATLPSEESEETVNASGETNTGRRAFLIGTAMASASAVLAQEKKKVDGGLAAIEDKKKPNRTTPITPPGSISAKNMAQHCTACQLCVSACPNGVLRPSTELDKFMQPTVSYERGYCRPECNRCSTVCPTGAIRLLDLAEKSATHIGHAVWVKKNCVCVTDGVSCGNCARHCPAGAIIMVPLDPNNEESVKVPAVNESACIGCGACENLCPARPFSAIYVEGHEVHRVD